MSNWNFLNAHRIHTGEYASQDSDGFNGAFIFPVRGLHIGCIASDGLGWQHVSVTHKNNSFTPSWETMCAVKDLFWEPEDWVVQFHPAKSHYINQHPGCLHLWRPLKAILPVPEDIMVGFTSLAELQEAKRRIIAENR